jgi:hypothetical protein
VPLLFFQEHYSVNQAFIQSQPISFQFSSRTEVTTTNKTTNEVKEGGRVLLVTILNARLPVSINDLYTVFANYGTVARIITFQKPNQGFKALIEMAHSEQVCSGWPFFFEYLFSPTDLLIFVRSC